MQYLELTEQKARELNDLCQFAVEMGANEMFDIRYYKSKRKPDMTTEYLRHLLDVAKQYDGVHRLIKLSDKISSEIHATHNTQEFLKGGGFLRILKMEKAEDDLQFYNIRSLRQSTMGTRDWYRAFVITLIVTIATAITTTLLTNQFATSPPVQPAVTPLPLALPPADTSRR